MGAVAPVASDLPDTESTPNDRFPTWVRVLFVVGLLYAFLVGIKAFGSDFTDGLFESVANPLAGLFVGTLATVLVGSSSVTTATIVGLVGAGSLLRREESRQGSGR